MHAGPSFGTFLEERRIPFRRNEPLAPHTTFRVGGPAKFFVEPLNEDQVADVFRAARECDVPVRILGGGANLVVRDEGVSGVVVKLTHLRRREGSRVQAGYPLARLVKETVMEGCSGLEALAGVPGSVGGAVTMNAGGRNGEIGAAVRYVDAMTHEGEVRRIGREEAGFRYRGSALDGYVVLAADLELLPDEGVRDRYEEILSAKKRAQPLGRWSAGCMFKNPPGQSAGRLVDEHGLKGARVGGAYVSRKHANFMINDGTATASDVFRLVDLVRRRVPVELELEVLVW